MTNPIVEQEETTYDRITFRVPFGLKVWLANYCRVNRVSMSDLLQDMLGRLRQSVDEQARETIQG